MILLDAYAVLALFKGEPAADEVTALFARDEVRLTSVGVAEIIDHLVRLMHVDFDTACLDVASLPVRESIVANEDVARRAGELRAHHYHRTTRAVSLADCLLAASARDLQATLATADPHLLSLCVEERIDVVVLPDSAGRRWSAPR